MDPRIASKASAGVSSRLARAFLDLGRISNLPTVWSNVVGAWFVAGGNASFAILPTALAASLIYYGGMALNDVWDAGWDARHGKERPIPRGSISRQAAAWAASLSMLAGAAGLLVLGANPLWVPALLLAILSYNALHKRWTGSIWLMGACRFFLFICVASIPSRYLALEVWLWALSLLGYVAGITLAARGEDTGHPVAKDARILLGLPVILGLAMTPWSDAPLFRAFFALLFAAWIVLAYRNLRGPRRIGGFVSALLAGMVFIDALAAVGQSPLAAFVCLALLPVTLLMQRVIAAT